MTKPHTKDEKLQPEDFPLEKWILRACRHPFVSLLILFLGGGLLPYIFTNALIAVTNHQNWRVLDPNEIGDSFGFVNALMSSLAAFGVAYAIYLQITELRESRTSERQKELAQQISERRLAATATGFRRGTLAHGWSRRRFAVNVTRPERMDQRSCAGSPIN